MAKKVTGKPNWNKYGYIPMANNPLIQRNGQKNICLLVEQIAKNTT